MQFEDVNKGFEGIYYFEKSGKRYFMGLCESNFCKTIVGPDAPGLDRGNGRVVLAEMVSSPGKGLSLSHPGDQGPTVAPSLNPAPPLQVDGDKHSNCTW